MKEQRIMEALPKEIHCNTDLFLNSLMCIEFVLIFFIKYAIKFNKSFILYIVELVCTVRTTKFTNL